MGRSRLGVLAVASMVVGAMLTGCGSSGPVVMTISPQTALYDAPLRTTITGLPSGATTTLTAATPDQSGHQWVSHASFTADSDGRVSLDQPATGGSYRGSDPMGLINTLAPTGPAPSQASFFTPPSSGFTVTLQATVDGRPVAHATARRKQPNQLGVTTHPETPATAGFVGNLYLPAHFTGAKPAVLAFGGSEGGMSSRIEAELLAAHGYPALALAYFDAPGVPPTLTNIPLEYFVTALKFLATQPGVDPRRIYTLGGSRGSEAALLLGAHFPQLVHGVIATSPSSVVYGSLPPTTPPSPAWTLGGKPVPTAPPDDWNNPSPTLDAPQAIIPVQHIHGPVILLCGGEDRLWSSCPYSEAIAQHRPGQPTTLLRYPTAGHFVDLLAPYLPYVGLQGGSGNNTYTTGGTVLANQQADAQAWPRILGALRQP